MHYFDATTPRTCDEIERDEITSDNALTLVKGALPAAVASLFRDFQLDVLDEARRAVADECEVDVYEHEVGSLRDVALAIREHLNTVLK